MISIIHENEKGLAIIRDEYGIIHLPQVETVSTKLYDGTRNMVSNKPMIYIADANNLCFVKQLPEHTPHQRMLYSDLCNDKDYAKKTSLLLRFAGNFIR